MEPRAPAGSTHSTLTSLHTPPAAKFAPWKERAVVVRSMTATCTSRTRDFTRNPRQSGPFCTAVLVVPGLLKAELCQNRVWVSKKELCVGSMSGCLQKVRDAVRTRGLRPGRSDGGESGSETSADSAPSSSATRLSLKERGGRLLTRGQWTAAAAFLVVLLWMSGSIAFAYLYDYLPFDTFETPGSIPRLPSTCEVCVAAHIACVCWGQVMLRKGRRLGAAA